MHYHVNENSAHHISCTLWTIHILHLAQPTPTTAPTELEVRHENLDWRCIRRLSIVILVQTTFCVASVMRFWIRTGCHLWLLILEVLDTRFEMSWTLLDIIVYMSHFMYWSRHLVGCVYATPPKACPSWSEICLIKDFLPVRRHYSTVGINHWRRIVAYIALSRGIVRCSSSCKKCNGHPKKCPTCVKWFLRPVRRDEALYSICWGLSKMSKPPCESNVVHSHIGKARIDNVSPSSL